MNSSPEIDKIAKALAESNKSIKNPEHNARVAAGKAGNYTHADMCAIIEATKKILAENGISIIQSVREQELTTRLIHESGQWIETYYPFYCNSTEAKGIGGWTTYMRKYAINATLFIYGDKDVDNDSFYKDEKDQMQPLVDGSNKNSPVQAPVEKKTADAEFSPEEKQKLNAWKDQFGVYEDKDLNEYITAMADQSNTTFDYMCLRAMRNEAGFTDMYKNYLTHKNKKN